MSQILPIKFIAPSIDAILTISNESKFVVSLDKSHDHYLHNCSFNLKKGNRQFDFSSTVPIRLGVDSYANFQINKNESVKLSNENGLTLHTTGQNVLINKLNTSNDHKYKIFSGGISMFFINKNLIDKDDQYLRFIIPTGAEKPFRIEDFQRYLFEEKTNEKTSRIHFVKLNVEGEMHLFNYSHSDLNYLIIDCPTKISVVSFQKKCYSILLALGFIKGHFIHDECFILSFDNEDMSHSVGMIYNSLRTSIQTQQPLFTTNFYSIYQDTDYLSDDFGRVLKEDPLYKRLQGDMLFFPDHTFSKLSELCLQSEKIQRSVLIFIDSHLATLETKIPNYYVVLEAVGGYIYEERKRNAKEKISVAPIKDQKLANHLIEDIKELIKSFKMENNIIEDDFSLDILFKNVDRLNSPPNADKLKEVFTYVGYELTIAQKKLLIDRNRFLHGSFLKIVGDEELFREGLHSALKLESMIAVLIFKLAGFSGPIINYTALRSDITELGVDEERVWDI
jgi:hypothetical protein